MAPKATKDFEVFATPSTYNGVIAVLTNKSNAYKSSSRRIDCRTFEACKESALKASALARVVIGYGYNVNDKDIREKNFLGKNLIEIANPELLLVPDNQLEFHFKFEAVFRSMILCLPRAEVEHYRRNLPERRVGREVFSLSEIEFELLKARLVSQVDLERSPSLAPFAKSLEWKDEAPQAVDPQAQMPLPPAVPEQAPQSQLPQQQQQHQQSDELQESNSELSQISEQQHQQSDELQESNSELSQISESQPIPQLPGQETNQPMIQATGQEELPLQFFYEDLEELDIGQLVFSLPDQQFSQPPNPVLSQEVPASQLPAQQSGQPLNNTFSQEVPAPQISGQQSEAPAYQFFGQQSGQQLEYTFSQETPASQLSGQQSEAPAFQFFGQQSGQQLDTTFSQEAPEFQFFGQQSGQQLDNTFSQETPASQLPGQQSEVPALQFFGQQSDQLDTTISQEIPASQFSGQQSEVPALQFFGQQSGQQLDATISQEIPASQFFGQQSGQQLEYTFSQEAPASQLSGQQSEVPAVQFSSQQSDLTLDNTFSQEAPNFGFSPLSQQAEEGYFEMDIGQPRQDQYAEQHAEQLRLLRLRAAFLQNPVLNPLPQEAAPVISYQENIQPDRGILWNDNTFEDLLDMED